MDKYKRYYGVIVVAVIVFVLGFVAFKTVMPKVNELQSITSSVESKNSDIQQLQQKLNIVQRKIRQIKDSIVSSQKKIYSPIEADLGNETLFFTLYNDVIEMIHANSVKIKTIDYKYNPEGDAFVQFGKDVYFVCDINLELISNYVNLGKLIQDLYQYPYYVRINEIEVTPYAKDKKILLSKMSLRLYAHTAPDTEDDKSAKKDDGAKLEGAETELPE